MRWWMSWMVLGSAGCITTQRRVVCREERVDPGCVEPMFASEDECYRSDCDIEAALDYDDCRAAACDAGTDPADCEDLRPDCG